ncbi:hypothetical protein [Bradyrhizobium sp. 188]|uniref:hypothetical protein n=1 Tax=Bradyrhizobium sp. 188 TaxID=2782656 RepID=UPI001FFBED40|nr:hypothetical protein [Bradyrhizobium sp. 188]MCK1498917.1 hypothetical protein [Bradyrhizobium sp. 188]
MSRRDTSDPFYSLAGRDEEIEEQERRGEEKRGVCRKEGIFGSGHVTGHGGVDPLSCARVPCWPYPKPINKVADLLDELEQTHEELDAKRELIKVQPTLDAKQPYSRTAFERLRDLDAIARSAADGKPVTPRGGALVTGLQSPQNRTGSSLRSGIRFLGGGCHFDGI